MKNNYITIYITNNYIKYLKLSINNYGNVKIANSGIIGCGNKNKLDLVKEILDTIKFNKTDRIISNNKLLCEIFKQVHIIENPDLLVIPNSIVLDFNDELIIKSIIDNTENLKKNEFTGMNKVYEELIDLTGSFDKAYTIMKTISLTKNYKESKLKILQESIKRIVDEIIEYVLVETVDIPFESICLDGIGALIPNIADYIKEKTNYPVKILYPKLENNKNYSIKERQQLIEVDDAVKIFNSYYINSKFNVLVNICHYIKYTLLTSNKIALLDKTTDDIPIVEAIQQEVVKQTNIPEVFKEEVLEKSPIIEDVEEEVLEQTSIPDIINEEENNVTEVVNEEVLEPISKQIQ